MSDMIEVQIDSVRVHLMTPSRLVVLKQVNSERYLPIWVGPYEAEAITVALQEVEMIRPLTHDLLKNVFGAFNARITRIEIVKLENDIYYGTIVAEVDGREIFVDSRSSDAIALSVRKTCRPCLGKQCAEPFCLSQIGPDAVYDAALRISLYANI